MQTFRDFLAGPPALGFGAAPIGNLYRPVSDEEAHAAVDAAWDAGIRYFDTAPYYGLGLSEQRLGEALASRPRSEYVLSTKAGKFLLDEMMPASNGLVDGQWALAEGRRPVRRYTRDAILRSLEESLVRLRTDHLDVVYLHDPDDHLDIVRSEAAPTLEALREEGVISACGVGTSSVAAARSLMKTTGLDGVLIAGRWTLMDRQAAQLLTEARDSGRWVVAAAPFNSGLLARDAPSPEATFEYARVDEPRLALARALGQACRRHGVSLPAAALQFARDAPAVVAVLVGMGSADEVATDVAAFDQPIPAALWQEIDAILAAPTERD